ncbi:SNARE associated Golgi protein [bacterium BMS3Bbin11]|nr:SNARE associated Golgi protein [bacterium BMS3Abin11]GBE46064.1 SNARE associated Golgi protein [bacterium BMS3Bbin11]HDH16730.1 DedA family protein [Gammaproteobacteria bacterium]HDZ78192.1 DedA family protein [Gammaproteobacteria bacterium]
MAVFASIYKRVIEWARHRHASYYLTATSVAESSFFPVPVDVLLAPMVLARRDKAWWYATLATVGSVAGAVVGYYIGLFLFDQVAQPIIDLYNFQEKFVYVQSLFNEYGVWIIFIAGFSPVPYKVFTITAGVVGMPLLPFILTSLVARGARFFLVAGLVYAGGDKIDAVLKKRVEQIGWASVVIIVLAAIIYQFI